MARQKFEGKRLFILDTNVLMHDPSSLLRFDEHDIFLPMVVLEELDAAKKGVSEVARNVRQVNRFIDALITNRQEESIENGIPLPENFSSTDLQESKNKGKLFFQQSDLNIPNLSTQLPGNKPDNSILAVTAALEKKFPERKVTLVSKDLSMRIKAGILGIHAEDYFNDRVVYDIDLLRTGYHILPSNFWEEHSKDMTSWKAEGVTFYRLKGPIISALHPNDFLIKEDENFQATVISVNKDEATIRLIRDYTQPNNAVWGITARNREQNWVLNLLMNPDIDLVTLQGIAGTGKTLLALAAGLAQTFEQNLYREILMTRVTIPVGEDIGFLPGTEEEKMTPWMGALMDNLEVLHQHEGNSGDWEKQATEDLLKHRIKVRSLNFMRGRTFLNRYIIIDEAQNLTPKQLKTLITRSGPGTKIVCLGDIKQIDTPYLTEASSGLTYVVDRFKHWDHSGHMTLVRGERSRLADYAADVL